VLKPSSPEKTGFTALNGKQAQWFSKTAAAGRGAGRRRGAAFGCRGSGSPEGEGGGGDVEQRPSMKKRTENE